MLDTHKFNFREWLVPPLLVPLFFGLLIAALVVLRQCSEFEVPVSFTVISSQELKILTALETISCQCAFDSEIHKVVRLAPANSESEHWQLPAIDTPAMTGRALNGKLDSEMANTAIVRDAYGVPAMFVGSKTGRDDAPFVFIRVGDDERRMRWAEWDALPAWSGARPSWATKQ